ncbi:MAG: DUF4169 family protein [Paracoccaceae bacterium]|nr:DUF4169 family protein [Paracoccaceae bacterium]
MVEIVNLRRARKQRARQERQRRADANAALHGISKSARDADSKAEALREARLEGHVLDEKPVDD